VLAADTVVSCGRRILPKAEDAATVRQCLELLFRPPASRDYRCRRCRAGPKESVHGLSVTAVMFRRLTAVRNRNLRPSREGEGKAGGYAIQGRAEVFVKRINGSYSNVVGLPLAETVALLRGSGTAVEFCRPRSLTANGRIFTALDRVSERQNGPFECCVGDEREAPIAGKCAANETQPAAQLRYLRIARVHRIQAGRR